MKEMGAAVSQANETNNPDITGAPHFQGISHVPSLLVQENSCKKITFYRRNDYLVKLKSPFLSTPTGTVSLGPNLPSKIILETGFSIYC